MRSTLWWRLSILLTAVLTTGACSFEVDGCDSDEDCPTNTVCASGGTGVALCIAEEPEPDSEPSDTEPDPEDTNNPSDEPEPPAPECPLFDGCGDDEPNDTARDAVYFDRATLGCAGFGLDQWRESRHDYACGGDQDTFLLEYVPCEASTFRLVLELETPEGCGGGVLELVDSPFQCGDSNVRCESYEQGERITALIDTQEFPQPVEEVRFAVRPVDPEVGVEYILRASVSQ